MISEAVGRRRKGPGAKDARTATTGAADARQSEARAGLLWSRAWLQLAAAVALSPSLLASAQQPTLKAHDLEARFKAPVVQSNAHVLRQAQVRTISPGTQVNLQVGEMVAYRLEGGAKEISAATGPEKSRALHLPFGFLERTASGSTSVLRPEVQIEGGGLMATADGFRGTLAIGLTDTENPARFGPLGQPVMFLVAASTGRVTPADLTIDHVNLPFSRVEIETQEASPEVLVSIRPSFTDEAVDLEIPVRRLHMILRASPLRIQGLGLETSRLTVALEPPPSAPVTVRLSSDIGQPQPDVVTVSGPKPAAASLRSSGLEGAVVRAEAAFAEETELKVEFVFPLAFLISALIGGGLGALLRALIRRRSSRGTRIWPHIPTGLITGLFVAALYTIGINVLGLAFAASYGEALTFALAGLGAYGGTHLLKIGALKGA